MFYEDEWLSPDEEMVLESMERPELFSDLENPEFDFDDYGAALGPEDRGDDGFDYDEEDEAVEEGDEDFSEEEEDW